MRLSQQIPGVKRGRSAFAPPIGLHAANLDDELDDTLGVDEALDFFDEYDVASAESLDSDIGYNM